LIYHFYHDTTKMVLVGQVGSGHRYCLHPWVSSGRVQTSVGRVGSGQGNVTHGQLWSRMAVESQSNSSCKL